jgi:predicted alpha/beta hydrolase family esterase
MKNAIIFHGTEGYPEENWFPWLKGELEKVGYKVSVPQFPSPPIVPAKIAEWWEILKSYNIDEDTVLIGHSLGGKFLLRILEKLDKPVQVAVFVGTPIGIQPIANNERDNAFTGNGFDWERIKSNAKRFEVFQSDTDPYVGLENGKVLAERLGVKLNFISNAGHFNKSAGYTKFPQLLEKILS